MRVLVTGATSGIGLAATEALANDGRDDLELLLQGRDPTRGEQALRATGAARFLRADLLVQDEVRRLADEARPVDVLVNNAGAVFGELALTPDGHERTWALNHLAPFLLTRLLEPPRVVTVSSAAHRRATVDWEAPDAAFGWPAYKQSKLANVLFTRALARRGTTAFALDPGVVATRFAEDLDADDPLKRRLTGQRRSDPRTPGETIARLVTGALDPPSGSYVGASGGTGRLDPAARDDDEAERLWSLSERATA